MMSPWLYDALGICVCVWMLSFSWMMVFHK